MSLGVTSFPDNAADSTGLIHDADVAVYQAKLQGRNRVICAWDVEEAIKKDSGPLALSERLGADYSTGLLKTDPLSGTKQSATQAKTTSPLQSGFLGQGPASAGGPDLQPSSLHSGWLPHMADSPPSPPGPRLKLFVGAVIAAAVVVTVLG